MKGGGVNKYKKAIVFKHYFSFTPSTIISLHSNYVVGEYFPFVMMWIPSFPLPPPSFAKSFWNK